MNAINKWTAAHAATGGILGWLGLDWQYAVGAAVGSVALERAARERYSAHEEGSEHERAIADLIAFLAAYYAGRRIGGGQP